MTRLQRVLKRAEIFYDNDDPGHDMAHVQRVMNTCEKLGQQENADLEILLPAALLHDIVNLPKDHPERAQAGTMAATRSREVLHDCGYTPAEIEYITLVIQEHSYSLGKKPSTIESAILQDADRIDALGAIGILRTVTCGCRLGATYYDTAEPFASTRALDDKSYTVDHFYVKLLKLAEKMNTVAGKAEAQKRTEFMTSFLAQLRGEISAAAPSSEVTTGTTTATESASM